MASKHILTVGNPNSGKTTLFNRLTGGRQEIGNWAGVTVDKKTGEADLGDTSCSLTDLPGIYTLDNADGENSLDESIAISALFSLPSDLIINVVDAGSLERGLYLTLQLRELGRPMVVVLNKMDVAEKQGFDIDTHALSLWLGCEVLTVTATSPSSIADFKTSLARVLAAPSQSPAFQLDYREPLEAAICTLTETLASEARAFPRASAMRLLCGDLALLNTISPAVKIVLDNVHQSLSGHDIDLIVADVRYTYVADVCHRCKQQIVPLTARVTDAIDNLVLHRYLGIPLFLP